MSYLENHLRNWLVNHPCLNVSCLEKTCDIKERNIAFFKNNQRRISVDEFQKVVKVISDYGYVPLNVE